MFQRLGFVAFMGSLAWLGWWWAVEAGRATSAPDLTAAAMDAGLFTLFAAHHSVMARPVPQQWLRSVVPPARLRSVYVWVASLLLALMCAAWRPVGGTLYEASGPLLWLLRLAQAAGLVLVLGAVQRIRIRELAGLEAPDPSQPLEQDGPYGLVRHPIYLGWVLIFCTAPQMTGDRALFAALSSAYLALAVPFEEAGLRRQFGARYAAYSARVRWRIIPWLY